MRFNTPALESGVLILFVQRVNAHMPRRGVILVSAGVQRWSIRQGNRFPEERVAPVMLIR